MSVFEDIAHTGSDVWHGRSDMIGDVAGLETDSAAIGLGLWGGGPKGAAAAAMSPVGGRVAGIVNHDLLGHDPHEQQQQQGNWGNHTGSVLGALGGSVLGPVGAAGGAALGSAAGGWIANHI